MKKIGFKLRELKNPQILTAKELKNVMGGSSCYTGMSCGQGGRCVSTPAGSNCLCADFTGYNPNDLCTGA